MNKQEFLRKAENCEFSYILTENGKAYYLVKDLDDKYWALLGIFNKEYIFILLLNLNKINFYLNKNVKIV